MKQTKVDNKYYMFILIIYTFIFQDFLQEVIPIFRYFDEILALLFIPICILNLIKNNGVIKIKDNNFKLFISLLIVFLVGMISIMLYQFQPIQIAIVDALLIFKFFMVYYVSKMTFDSCFIDKNKNGISFHIRLIVILLMILTIANYCFKLWPYDYRFGIMANRLFYKHPTSLAATCILLIAFLFMTKDEKKDIIKYVAICLLILLSTLRLKAIATAVLTAITVIYILLTKERITVAKTAIVAIIAIIIAFNQISYYYIEIDGSARKQLTLKSIAIAKDYFPIGTGFGSYGSYMSAYNYSKVYMLYDLDNVYGLERENTSFVNDTFWPMILGQFGILGLICYAIAIIFIYKEIQQEFNQNNIYPYVAKIICLGYLLISSTSECTFVHPIAIPLAFIIGIKINIKKGNKNENINC